MNTRNKTAIAIIKACGKKFIGNERMEQIVLKKTGKTLKEWIDELK